MRNLIYILLLITLFSCQNNGLITELENAYSLSAESEKDSLLIENFEILKKRTVDFEFIRIVKINDLERKIELNKNIIENLEKYIGLYEKSISNRKRLIELNPIKKDKYLARIEYDQQELENSKVRKKKIEDEIAITSQEIVLVQAEELGRIQNNYELIDFVFKGEINGVKRIDTMSILKVSEDNMIFIKDNFSSDYNGI